MPATRRCNSTLALGAADRAGVRLMTTVACPPGAGMRNGGSNSCIVLRSSAFMGCPCDRWLARRTTPAEAQASAAGERGLAQETFALRVAVQALGHLGEEVAP